jgi:hypothetical protein
MPRPTQPLASGPTTGPGDLLAVISIISGAIVLFGAYLFFLGSLYSYYYYAAFGISARLLDAPANTVLRDAYYPISKALGLHTVTAVCFTSIIVALLVLFSLHVVSTRRQLAVRLAALILLVPLFSFTVEMAKEAAAARVKIPLSDVRNPVCVYLKKDSTDAMPRGFLERDNRRCNLEMLAETRDLLFLLDLSTVPQSGHPGHVFVLRRDEVDLIDTNFFH